MKKSEKNHLSFIRTNPIESQIVIYGKYTNPPLSKVGISNHRMCLRVFQQLQDLLFDLVQETFGCGAIVENVRDIVYGIFEVSFCRPSENDGVRH